MDISSAISVRIKALNQVKIRGQFNHDLRLGRQPNYVDQSRLNLNRVLINYPTPEFCKTDTETRRRKTGTTRRAMSNQAVATSAIITFGVKAQHIFSEGDPQTQDEALLAVANTIADHYKLTVHGLVLHLDETAPHAHVVFSARDHQGKPFSKTNRGSKIQDLAADAIKQYFPQIERGIRKRDRIAAGEAPSKIYHRSVKHLHEDLGLANNPTSNDVQKAVASLNVAKDKNIYLQAENTRLEAKRSEIESDIEAKTTSLAELQAKEEKLLGYIAKNEAKLENLETLIRKSQDLIKATHW